MKREVRSKEWFHSKRETIICSNLLEKEKRRDENKRGLGQGVRKSLVQQLKREERKK